MSADRGVQDDRKYTERDVRDDPSLHEAAVEYLEGYTGEFEFLVDMRLRLSAGMGITNAMAKGVLNCMRQDARVGDLPRPKTTGAVVVPFQRPGRRDRAAEERARLSKAAPGGPDARPPWTCYAGLGGMEHDGHHGRDSAGDWQSCRGWHEVDREIVTTRARLHAPYLRGKQSNLIHRSTHEGTLTWFPRDFHREGQAEVTFWEVPTRCPIVAMRNPELLDAEGVRAARPRTTPTAQRSKYPEVTLCPRCFPGTEGVYL